jgi:(p)ppGpp synthase/HD superfamily hydrolase
MNTRAWSPRYDAALALAARAHRNQVRKGTDTPYITHVVAVSVILLRHGFDEDLAIAGLLHDVVEDCDVEIETIRAQFGARIAQLVAAVSEQKAVDGTPLPWEQRKADKLAHLRDGGPDVAALKAADAMHNARSIAADVQRDGPAVWQRFKGSPQQTLWYYEAIAAGVRQWLHEHPIALELRDAVAVLSTLV